MNESDLRAELQRLATAGPAGPARLNIDEMLRDGHKRILRRRSVTFPASLAAAALVVLSSVGVIRLTSDQFSGPSQLSTPAAQIPEAANSTDPTAAQWAVPIDYPAPPRGTRFLVPGPGAQAASQATLVQGHVAF